MRLKLLNYLDVNLAISVWVALHTVHALSM
jgi:hypothetical protein